MYKNSIKSGKNVPENDLLWTNTMQDIDVNDAWNEFDMKFVTVT